MKLQSLLFFVVVFLFGFASIFPVHAFEMRKEDAVTVAKGEVVKGSLFAGGKTVVVYGVVDGDLYCAGRTVDVRGTVTGDVICAAQTITISGVVGGNVRSAGQLVDITGTVKKNVSVAGQTVNIEPGAVVTGEVFAAGQTIMLDGEVGPGVLAAGQTIQLNDSVPGDVTAYAQSITLGEKARINGNLTYTSPGVLSQVSSAAVTGKITHLLPPKQAGKKPVLPKLSMLAPRPWPLNAVGAIVFYLVVGLITVLIAPKKLSAAREQMLARPWFDGAIGLVALIFTPIVAILVAITIIGIPVALVIGFLFALTIIISRILVSVIVGKRLLTAARQNKSTLMSEMAVGVVILELLIKLPIAGWLVGFAALLWGMGGVVMSFKKAK